MRTTAVCKVKLRKPVVNKPAVLWIFWWIWYRIMPFSALSNNKLMLQVIFLAMFLGISLLLVGEKSAKPLKDFFDSLNDVVLKMVDLIMLSAPYAVFALLANVVVSSGDPELLYALLFYSGVVVGGLALMICFYLVVGLCNHQKKSTLVFETNQSSTVISIFYE